jgi:CxxC motif-containing protein (DUF1111 family)
MDAKHVPLVPSFLLAASLAVGCTAATTEVAPAEPGGDEDIASALKADRQPVETAFGDPMPGLGADELARFEDGRDEFEEVEEAAAGLGPVFNETSCARCHSVPGSGGGSDILETRFGTASGGAFDPLAQRGGSLIQEKGIGTAGACDFAGEVVPPEATLVSLRRTTPLFGLGLVDALPDSVFHYVAHVEARYFPREAGRPAMVHDIAKNRTAVGRFGWKGQVPSLHQFSGDAYLNEMGITSPEFPDENCPQGDCALLACNPMPELNDDGSGVQAFADFMTFLAPPPRARFSEAAFFGRGIFSAIGCTRCHWSTFRTGDRPTAALRQITFHPYSDFLLHDMGSLGDGIETGDARGNEFRTAPLWGVSAVTRFLHDGRAAALAEAILAHDGQARRVRDRFADLAPEHQGAVLAFLSSL